jgi:ubiquinone biosynthesis protein
MRKWSVRTQVPEVPYHEKSVAVIYNDVIRILYEHDCTMEWALLRIRRAQETLDASLLYLVPEVDYSEIAARYFRAADRRQAVMTRADRTRAADLSAVRAVLGATAQLDEFTLLRAPAIRQRVYRVVSAASRLAQIVATGVSRLAFATSLVAFLVVVAYVAQRHPSLLAAVVGGAATSAIAVVPPLDGQAWALVCGASVGAAAALLRLRARMLRHDPGPRVSVALF